MVQGSHPVRFAVIGAGMIGGLHARIISEMPEAELVCVYSRSLDRAKELTDIHGGEPTTDFEGVLQRQDVNAVSICTAKAVVSPPSPWGPTPRALICARRSRSKSA